MRFEDLKINEPITVEKWSYLVNDYDATIDFSNSVDNTSENIW